MISKASSFKLKQPVKLKFVNFFISFKKISSSFIIAKSSIIKEIKFGLFFNSTNPSCFIPYSPPISNPSKPFKCSLIKKIVCSVMLGILLIAKELSLLHDLIILERDKSSKFLNL